MTRIPSGPFQSALFVEVPPRLDAFESTETSWSDDGGYYTKMASFM